MSWIQRHTTGGAISSWYRRTDCSLATVARVVDGSAEEASETTTLKHLTEAFYRHLSLGPTWFISPELAVPPNVSLASQLSYRRDRRAGEEQ